MDELEARFAGWLQREGRQVTAQRLRVARRIGQLGGHRSLADLQADTALVDVGEITVYRTVRLMEEAGLLERLMVDDVARYEVAGEHHDHFHCVDCGAVVEFHSPELESLQVELARSLGFQVSGHAHVVEVRCGCVGDRAAR